MREKRYLLSRLRAGWWIGVFAWAIPLPVWANAGPFETSASVVAEPIGIRDVSITRETLTIDLRPVADGKPAQVEAVYHLHNRGPERRLDLVFAFGSNETSDFQVLLGDQAVAVVPVEWDKTHNAWALPASFGEPAAGPATTFRRWSMPRSWQLPEETPGLGGGRGLKYGGSWSPVRPAGFTVVVPPGRETLRVRYLARVKHTYARPAMYRQFAYILAPARAWDSFGGLDVTVYLPDGWSVASNPALNREGDALRGTFDAIPADALALTFRPPVPSGYRAVTYTGWGLFGLAGFGGLALCWWGGRAKGRFLGRLRRGESAPQGWLRQTAWPRSLGLGVLYGGLVLAAGLIAVLAADALFPPTAAEQELIGKLRLGDAYGTVFALIGLVLLSLLAVPVGFCTAQVTAALAARRGVRSGRAAMKEDAAR